jgi:cephalosporin-C deacetylase-like acetyl esterase
MNPLDLYPTPIEIDRWVDEIRAAAKAPCTVAIEPMPESAIGPLQAMAANRYLRFDAKDAFFYGLFQPALSQPAPLVVHVPGYGSEISLHPEIVTLGYNVLHVQPMGYMTPKGRNEALIGSNGHWPVLPDTIRSLAQGGYKIFLTQCSMMIDWALAQDFSFPGRVSFFGTSQGGGGSLLLGSLYSGRGTRCVAADQPFLTNYPKAGFRGAYEIMKEAFAEVSEQDAWRALGYVDTLSHVHRLGMPVMITSGTADVDCPPDTIEPLFGKFGGTKAYISTKGMAHGHNREFTKMAGAWLNLYA